jgi:tRNA 2-selenouridine synthase
MQENTRDFRHIFLSGAPMMDTRAPIEYSKGAFPGTVNLPLMDDNERHLVGTCYKQKGQQAAIELGHQLVSGALRDQRIAAWADFARAHPNGYLYCFRGGLRSHTVQQWLKTDAGIDYPLVSGGYKAMRTFLLDTTEQAARDCDFVVLGGMTGTGKTDVLLELHNSIDLEGHAHHRGSSFGKRATAQPTPIDFENRLAIDLLKKRDAGTEQFVLEDESRIIGACAIPLPLFERMQQAPVVWLEDSLEHRVNRILRDYVADLCTEFVALHGTEQGFELFAQRLLQSLGKLTKRLGWERYQRLNAQMQAALNIQRRDGPLDLHRDWIEGLLKEYYDPMYAYQRQSKQARIEFAGNQATVLEHLRQRNG